MTKKEENQQNLNTSFKIKITKKDLPGIGGDSLKIKLGKGLYEQLSNANRNTVTYNPSQFSLQDIEDAVKDLYLKPSTRNLKVITNEAGMKMFNEALKEGLKDNKNEYRKRLSFKSKIFKQTYKFR